MVELETQPNGSLMVELEAEGYLGSNTCLQLGSMSFFLFP